MGTRAAILAAALAGGFCPPEARAQFGSPLGGGPYSLTAPEAGAGAIGAGAANTYNAPQNCTPDYRGRGGVAYNCAPDAPPAAGKGKN